MEQKNRIIQQNDEVKRIEVNIKGAIVYLFVVCVVIIGFIWSVQAIKWLAVGKMNHSGLFHWFSFAFSSLAWYRIKYTHV